MNFGVQPSRKNMRPLELDSSFREIGFYWPGLRGRCQGGVPLRAEQLCHIDPSRRSYFALLDCLIHASRINALPAHRPTRRSSRSPKTKRARADGRLLRSAALTRSVPAVRFVGCGCLLDMRVDASSCHLLGRRAAPRKLARAPAGLPGSEEKGRRKSYKSLQVQTDRFRRLLPAPFC